MSMKCKLNYCPNCGVKLVDDEDVAAKKPARKPAPRKPVSTTTSPALSKVAESTKTAAAEGTKQEKAEKVEKAESKEAEKPAEKPKKPLPKKEPVSAGESDNKADLFG